MSEDVNPTESDSDQHALQDEESMLDSDVQIPSQMLRQLIEAAESISRGDIRNARRIMSQVEANLDEADLKEPETELISTLRQQLKTDHVELYLPLFFFCVWALTFWSTLH